MTQAETSTVGNGMKPADADVQSVVIPGAGHWVAEQTPRRWWPR